MTNARLKNVFSLSSKVTVYVPATIDIDKEIDNKEFVDRAATLLSDCFGGATSTDDDEAVVFPGNYSVFKDHAKIFVLDGEIIVKEK